MALRPTHLIRAILLPIALLIPLSGCADGDASREQPEGRDQPGRLRIGATLEPEGLDPTTVGGAGTPFVLLYNVYETLVKIDGEGAMKPLLATDWSVSEDGLVYRFELDPAARFASGARVDAESVVASIERLASGQGRDVLTAQMSVVDEAVAVSEGTVEVRLKRPSNFWLFDMTQTAGIIFDPAGMGQLNTKPAGSGPYVFKEQRKGDSVTLEANPDYWGTKPRFDEVTFKFYNDANAMSSAMLAGQLDMISNMTATAGLNQFSDKSKYSVLEGTTPGEVVLGINHSTPALKDLRVRQAINYAIDRKGLLDVVWNGHGKLIGSMVPPSDPWYDPSLADMYPYDPDKARALLAEAGHSSGLKLRLRVPTLPYATASAQYVASQLSQVGVEVVQEELEFSTWLQQVYTNADYDMTIVAHVEPRDMPKWADPKYYWRYDNPQFQALIKAADEGPGEDETKNMKAAARLLATDAAGGFLFLLPQIVVADKSISGVSPDQTSESFDVTNLATRRR